MSKYFDESFVKSSVLFNRLPVKEMNDVLSKKHNLLFFEHNWQPRQYIEHESPRCMFMSALFNAYFLFHESVPMLTKNFNKLWEKNKIEEGTLIEVLICICRLRNIFAHNYINDNEHFSKLKKFVKYIDEDLPRKLSESYTYNGKHYLFSLPNTNEFWGIALEQICKMSNGIIDCCKKTIEDKEDIEKDYIKYYKLYILNYFEKNYHKEYENKKDFEKDRNKIDSYMNDTFLTEWSEEDIYPETICEKIISETDE